jgi:hypothetical protein
VPQTVTVTVKPGSSSVELVADAVAQVKRFRIN